MKLSPTRNTTLLVTSRHAVDDYPAIAAQLLAEAHVHGEQVGFVRRPTAPGAAVRLHMAGGEFCGNAVMALAALTAAGPGLRTDRWSEVAVEASGARAPLACRVRRGDEGYDCELPVPGPVRIEPFTFPGVVGRSVLVRYAEALHVVVECASDDPAARRRAPEVAARLAATEKVSVAGVMLYDPATGRLAPLVCVPSLGTSVWEGSCGSGAASVGAYLAARTGRAVRASLHQPGGTLHVRADHDTRGLTGLHVGGRVRVVAEGTAYVDV